MTNAETISKLSEALNTLIGAYEDLQNEKNELDKRIKQLEDEKGDLGKKLNDVNNNNERQNTNINSMLGKIENILGNNNPKELEKEVIKEEKIQKENEIKENSHETTNIFDSIEPVKKENLNIEVEPIKIEKNEKEDEKLDLNRMASLLNGFNR